jgi:hypothetical protein
MSVYYMERFFDSAVGESLLKGESFEAGKYDEGGYRLISVASLMVAYARCAGSPHLGHTCVSGADPSDR